MFRNDTMWLLLVAGAACGHPDGGGAGTDVARATEAPAAPTATPTQAEAVDEVPAAKFGDGVKAFEKAKQTLLQNYYAEGITEDDVYRAATAGMLEKLEPKMKKYNRLLSPREIAEMKNDLKGEIVGIGVHIHFDEASGYSDVLATIPGSPAEKAGLVSGDKIVTVGGKLYKGMRMQDVVADIRGKSGEAVTLSVLRGDKLVPMTIVREKVTYDQPAHMLVPEAVGYVRIPSFTDKTPSAVRAGLADLEAKGAKALVVDLRQCPGGSFDRALETAGAFLPEGAPIVTLKRKGKPEERHVAKGPPILVNVPMAVLVDGATASGCEILASAFQEGRHARLVGTKTFGKWSVQSVDDLPNGWAFKYTVSLFRTPDGESWDGVGLSPDIEVSMDERALARANAAKTPAERLAIDVQLRTAKEILVR